MAKTKEAKAAHVAVLGEWGVLRPSVTLPICNTYGPRSGVCPGHVAKPGQCAGLMKSDKREGKPEIAGSNPALSILHKNAEAVRPSFLFLLRPPFPVRAGCGPEDSVGHEPGVTVHNKILPPRRPTAPTTPHAMCCDVSRL